MISPIFSGRLPHAVRPYTTALSALVVLVLSVYLFVLPRADEKLDSLRFPAESAGRMVDRHLEFFEGIEQEPAWKRGFFAFLFGDRRDVQRQSVDIYQEVLDYLSVQRGEPAPWADINMRARLAVTLAELGDQRALHQALAELGTSLDAYVIRQAILYGYGDHEAAHDLDEVLYGARLLPLGWAADRLHIQIDQRSARTLGGAYAERRLTQNGAQWRDRVFWMAVVVATLIAAGLTVWVWQRPQAPDAWQGRALQGAWEFGDGLRVLVQAGALGLLTIVAIALLAGNYFRPGVVALWGSLVASLPMLWLIRRELLKPRGLTFASAYGLRLRGVPFSQWVGITLVVLAADLLGTLVIAWGSWQLGLEAHWSESVYERVIFGPWQTAVLSTVNVVIWAPVFEEIGFRGLVYPTLRRRLSVSAAIVISALLFSALHLYSLVGFLSVLWSGLVLAWAFERYRSLLPGMVVHGLANLFAIGTLLMFYR